jgi:hypothetical protein
VKNAGTLLPHVLSGKGSQSYPAMSPDFFITGAWAGGG